MMNISSFVSLLLVLPPIPGVQSGLRPGIYKHYTQQKTWREAQSFCREKHTDLVTIKDEQHNQLFHSGGGWIGLYRDEDGATWKWSRGNETATFLSWDTDEPDQKQHCGFKMFHVDKWRNDYCYKPHTFMCYDEKLVLVKDNKTWEEALEHCRSLGGGDSEKPIYDLPTLITGEDHQYARERTQEATTDEVWTGLRFLGDQWFWVSGEPVQYQDIPSCPAFRCGVLEKSSMTSFGIRDCSQRRNFFCYKKSQND